MTSFEDWVADAIRESVRSVAEEKRAGAAMVEAQERGDIAYALQVSSRVALKKGVEALARGIDASASVRRLGDGFSGEGEAA